MEAKCIKDHESKITLVENSGIQFLDYEITVDWDNKEEDPSIKGFSQGYFKTRNSQDGTNHFIRMVPDVDKGEFFTNPLITDDKPRESYDFEALRV